ncbi:hypothetical protein ABPG72_020539 [Tetrahymena utriculariae]
MERQSLFDNQKVAICSIVVAQIVSYFVTYYICFRIEPSRKKVDIYISQQYQYIKNNIFEVYIQDIRIFDVKDNQTCGYDEILVQNSKQARHSKEYAIYMMPIHDKNSTKQFIKLCYKQLQGYSYLQIQSSQKQNIRNYDCNYNQVSFAMVEESKRCPISNIIFSSEEEIKGYDKIPIPNNYKY